MKTLQEIFETVNNIVLNIGTRIPNINCLSLSEFDYYLSKYEAIDNLKIYLVVLSQLIDFTYERCYPTSEFFDVEINLIKKTIKLYLNADFSENYNTLLKIKSMLNDKFDIDIPDSLKEYN